jgi:hypothetical protein
MEPKAMATKTYPASAFRLTAEGVEFGSNGDGAKSIPVRLVARSPLPIDHDMFGGPIVHDLAGVQHKNKIPIDYIHDYDQVLGYANKFAVTPRGLELSGALVPYARNGVDRASEVIHKAANGVPYQASIFWGGELLQEVAANEVTPVNGYDFVGPGVVVRRWSLFGVAICPYGADENTSTEFARKLGDDRQITVQFLDVPADARRFVATDPTSKPPEATMPTEPETHVEPTTPAAPAAPAAAPAVEVPAPLALHLEPDDETPDEETPAAPAASIAPAADPLATPPTQLTPEQIRAAEGKRFIAKFGADRGPGYFTAGLSFEAACDRWGADLQTENQQLRDRLAKFAGGCETPPIFDPAEKGAAAAASDPTSLESKLGPNLARVALATNMPHSAGK